MTSQKCAVCNNITTNPSGRCYLHENSGSIDAQRPGVAAAPSLSISDSGNEFIDTGRREADGQIIWSDGNESWSDGSTDTWDATESTHRQPGWSQPQRVRKFDGANPFERHASLIHKAFVEHGFEGDAAEAQKEFEESAGSLGGSHGDETYGQIMNRIRSNVRYLEDGDYSERHVREVVGRLEDAQHAASSALDDLVSMQSEGIDLLEPEEVQYAKGFISAAKALQSELRTVDFRGVYLG